MSEQDEWPSAESLRQSMYENVARGYAKVVGEKDGEPIFAITEAGKHWVEEGLLDDSDPFQAD